MQFPKSEMKKIKQSMDCPDCANEIEIAGNERQITCGKCGSRFKPRILIYVKPHEYQNPTAYAEAHIKAAKKLLSTVR